jgi:hypothetical protein
VSDKGPAEPVASGTARRWLIDCALKGGLADQLLR